MTDSTIAITRKKEGRGVFLTFVMFIHSLFAINTLYSLIYPLTGGTRSYSLYVIRSDMEFLEYSISIVTIISIVFLWRWSKYGVYGLVLILLLCFTDTFLVITTVSKHAIYPVISIVLAYSSFLIPAVIYYWAIKRKWHLFS